MVVHFQRDIEQFNGHKTDDKSTEYRLMLFRNRVERLSTLTKSLQKCIICRARVVDSLCVLLEKSGTTVPFLTSTRP